MTSHVDVLILKPVAPDPFGNGLKLIHHVAQDLRDHKIILLVVDAEILRLDIPALLGEWSQRLTETQSSGTGKQLLFAVATSPEPEGVALTQFVPSSLSVRSAPASWN
jgi:hypothetical protein